MTSDPTTTTATTIGAAMSPLIALWARKIRHDDAGRDDEDAEPAADGPSLPLVNFDAGPRVADRGRLGVAVGRDGLGHGAPWRTVSMKVILNTS